MYDLKDLFILLNVLGLSDADLLDSLINRNYLASDG